MGLCLPCMGGAVKDVVETPDPVSADPGRLRSLPFFRPVVCERAVTPSGAGAGWGGRAAFLNVGPGLRDCARCEASRCPGSGCGGDSAQAPEGELRGLPPARGLAPRTLPVLCPSPFLGTCVEGL